LLKSQYNPQQDLKDLDNIILSEDSLGTFDLEQKLPPNTLLFQTGYLTIKSFDKDLRAYTLICPNEEVKLSLTTYLVSIITHKDKQQADAAVLPFIQH
jgi:hypothetical protein